MALKPPHISSTTEPSLHLVGDHKTARCMHHTDSILQKARRVREDTIGGEDGIDHESPESDPVALKVLDR
jgi:hypothetical protein